MATPRNGLPEVWPSGLASWLSGEATCGFRPWFKAHHARYDKVPSTFDFAQWRMEHTALVKATSQALIADGWEVRLENANFFRVTGTSAILSGKPDIVARRKGVTKIVDCKSGVPKDEHAIQVAIYMVGLPLAWGAPKLFVTGDVVYKTHTVEVGPERLEDLRPRIFAALRELGAWEPLRAEPSEKECRFCDITVKDCSSRVEVADSAPVTTTMF